MGVCNQCKAIPYVFDDKLAKRELKKYRKKGASKTTQLLLDALTSRGIEGLGLLDIGGGIGAIQHELLKSGSSGAVGVDASNAYIAASRDEAEQQGHADRISYHFGDFVDLAEEIEAADIVTMDKVICCYPDMKALVRLSAERANKYYGVIYPRYEWWIRFGFAASNIMGKVLKYLFRVFAHPSADVDAIILSQGFEQVYYEKAGGMWQVVLYAKNGAHS